MIKSYDLKLVVCTLASVAFSGFGDTDAISFEWAEDIAEAHTTADGDTIYSRLNNRAVTVTVTLSQKSRAHTLMFALTETQHGDASGIHPPIMLGLPFFLLDPSTGETISGSAVILSRPTSNKGKTIGDVQYKLHIGKPVVTPAVANA
jgi:hypothetical protein